MLMANAVSQLAAKTPGKEAAAMEAFAAALRQVSTNQALSLPTCIDSQDRNSKTLILTVI